MSCTICICFCIYSLLVTKYTIDRRFIKVVYLTHKSSEALCEEQTLQIKNLYIRPSAPQYCP